MQLALQRLDAVGLLDAQRSQTREAERYAAQCARHHHRLRQVGHTAEVVVETRQHTLVTLYAHRREALALHRAVLCLHAQQREDIFHDGVALTRRVHEALEAHLRLVVPPQRQHLVPVSRRTPVALYRVLVSLVRLRVHRDGVRVAPVGVRPVLAHHPQREIDVRTRDGTVGDTQLQSVLQRRRNHQQRRDILRTDVACHLYVSALERAPIDAQRRIALLAQVFDVGAQIAQRIHQDAYRTLFHAVGTRDDMLARLRGEERREEAHRRARPLDVNLVRASLHRVDNHLRVVAHREVLRQYVAARQRMNDKCAVADAF